MTDQLIDKTLALIANGHIEAERAFMRGRVESFRKFQARWQREREAYANAVLPQALRPGLTGSTANATDDGT